VEVVLIAVMGDARMDQYMHAVDLFEHFKRLIDTDARGIPQCQSFYLTLEPKIAEPDYVKLIGWLKDAIAKEGSKRLLACFAPGIETGAWRDETCTHVSTGKSWCELAPLLERWGYAGRLHKERA